MSETLPDTIKPNDEWYDRLGSEFVNCLGRADGTRVAKSLHAYFEQDVRDFLDGVWPYFSGIPEDKWPQNDSILAQFNCRIAVAFFQSVRGAATANERGYVKADTVEWYTNWLLRFNLGESGAKQATEIWLPRFRERDREGQLKLFSVALSKYLPDIRGLFFLLNLYATTLEFRVQATTARAFGDISEAEKLHAEAVLLEEKCGAAIQQYLTGGFVGYVLENDQGLLIMTSQQYGKLFPLWTDAEYAKEMNEGQYGGTHRVSPMNYRELDGQLRRMQSAGQRYVILDLRMSGNERIVPIGALLQHVQETINAVESSELGKAVKRGFDEKE